MSGGLHDAFVDELRDAYDGEKQLLKALQNLAKAASSEQLKTAFQDHRAETQGHVQRLEEVFASIQEKPRGKHCDGIAGIVEEGKAIMEEDFDGAILDACLIAAGQRSEHYEMAAYGTLTAWAKALGYTEAADLLAGILEEEKAADEKLNQLAEGGINQQATEGQESHDEESGEGVIGTVKRLLTGGTGGAKKSSGRASGSRGRKTRGRKAAGSKKAAGAKRSSRAKRAGGAKKASRARKTSGARKAAGAKRSRRSSRASSARKSSRKRAARR